MGFVERNKCRVLGLCAGDRFSNPAACPAEYYQGNKCLQLSCDNAAVLNLDSRNKVYSDLTRSVPYGTGNLFHGGKIISFFTKSSPLTDCNCFTIFLNVLPLFENIRCFSFVK
jgi:hypothetical protein